MSDYSQDMKLNGYSPNCGIRQSHLDQIDEATINTRHILKHAKHLESLDSLKEIKDILLNAAIGRDQIQKSVFDTIIKTQNRAALMVITALCIIIVFLLTGEKFGIIGNLHR